MKRRVRLPLLHLGVSAVLVGLALALILWLWYPPPLGHLDGIHFVVLLIIGVDLCLGPLLTLVVSSEHKRGAVLARDLAVIAALQLGALTYGLVTAYVARPAYLVFNADRFDTVAINELARTTDEARPAIDARLTGPQWVQALPPGNIELRNQLLFSAVRGGPDLKHYPELYRPWPSDVFAVRPRLRGLEELRLDAGQKAVLDEALAARQLAPHQVAYVPLKGRERDGLVLLDRTDLRYLATLDLPPNY